MLSEGEIGKPHKYIYMFVIPCAELRFVWHIVNVHYCIYSREILMVLNFYFAPSLNLIDIIR